MTFSPGTKEIDLIHGDVPRGLDNGIMEAPWIIYREPFYYLFYSTSFYFNPHYNVKVARSLHVTGPYHKHPGYVLKVNGFKLERGATKFVGTGKNNKPFQNRLSHSYESFLSIFMELMKGQAGSSNTLNFSLKCGPACTRILYRRL